MRISIALRSTVVTAFFATSAWAVPAGSALFAGCAAFKDPTSPADARINATAHAPTQASLTPGKHKLGLGGGRDGYLYVPTASAAGTAVPLLLMLHGAGRASSEFDGLLHYADELGFAILAPDSREFTWDLNTGFGPDIKFIANALGYTFDHVKIDGARVGVAGFSDGASYSLTIGMANGDLFERIIAYSPGYYIATKPIGKPPIFIGHGNVDTVLSFEYTRDAIIPHLENAGYTVKFVPFDGGHSINDGVAYQSFDWWLNRR